jgi:hypothetical protein
MSFRTTLFGNIIESIATVNNIEAEVLDLPVNSYDLIKDSIEKVFNLTQSRPIYGQTLLGFYQGSAIAAHTASENSICG